MSYVALLAPRQGCVSAKTFGSFWNGRRIHARKRQTPPPWLCHTSFGPLKPAGADAAATFHSMPTTCAVVAVLSYSRVSGSRGLNAAVGPRNRNGAPEPAAYAEEAAP